MTMIETAMTDICELIDLGHRRVAMSATTRSPYVPSDSLPLIEPGPVGSRALSLLQHPLRWALNRYYHVQVHDEAFFPQTGPVIVAANHVGTLDGPLVVLSSPRPTYALAKNELFAGALGRALTLGGQIPLARTYADFPALRRAIQVLRTGYPLAIFPEGARGTGTCERIKGGIGYLALVTGAPVVMCALLGTRPDTGARKAMPKRDATLHVVYGRAISIPAVPWPRRRDQVGEVSELIRQRLAAHVAEAVERTGVALPGPVND